MNEAEAKELERKLAYYRKRLDEGAGRLIQADYRVAHLKHALEQRRRGFAFLAELQRLVSELATRDDVVRAVAEALIGSVGMHRAVVYAPEGEALVPRVALGFEGEPPVAPLPDALARADQPILVTRATAPHEVGAELLGALGFTSYVAVALRDDGVRFAVLVAGRVKEVPPLYPALDAVDVETFGVIASSISAALQTRRVAVLRELDQLRMDFFANISHEFRTPITLTLAPIDGLLAGRGGDLPEGALDALRLARRSQRRLLELINQILDLSKIEAGKAVAQRVPHGDAPALVESIARGFEEAVGARGLRLRVGGDAQPAGVVVPINVEMFDRAVTNLIANAVKFTESGEVSVTWRFTESALCLQVRDTGIGIDAPDLPFVFERFRRSASAKRVAGTGIGLSLVKEIVELHGGAVRVESQRHVGTTLELSFPSARGVAVAAPSPDARAGGAVELPPVDDGANVPAWNDGTARAWRSDRATVLYVDDNRDLRAHVGALLAGEFNTFLAGDGEAGLAQLRERAFDLILSDVMMPNVDGVELCRRVRADPALRYIPIVLLTAKAGEADRVAALDLGVDDYLSKPFSPAELMARARNLLRMRALQRQTERDIAVARSIQQRLLPAREVALGGRRVEHLYEPCDALSGDFCDVLTVGAELVFYVADVTSHGIAAAQVTYLVREAFRRHVREGDALPRLLAAVAEDHRAYGLAFNVSVHAALLRGDRLSLCRAGGPLAVLVREGEARVVVAPPSSTLASVRRDGELPVAVVDLLAGDQVFLFTDGAPELTTAGRTLGMRRMRAALAAASGASDWRAPLLELFATARREGGLLDDITVVRLLA